MPPGSSYTGFNCLQFIKVRLACVLCVTRAIFLALTQPPAELYATPFFARICQITIFFSRVEKDFYMEFVF